MTVHDYIRSQYTPPWLDPKSMTGPINIDDRNEYDISEAFCHLAVEFPSRGSEKFTLSLRNIPWNNMVEMVAEQLDGEWSDTRTGRCLTLTLTPKQVTRIRDLAEAIRKITGRGRRYANCNWKWVTQRVSTSLDQFADILMEYRRSERQGVGTRGE